jgi:hypothetical protein
MKMGFAKTRYAQTVCKSNPFSLRRLSWKGQTITPENFITQQTTEYFISK